MKNERLKLFAVGMMLGACVLFARQIFFAPPNNTPPTQSNGSISRQFQLFSDEYVLEKNSPTMHGPSGWSPRFSLDENATNELIWLTGISTQVVDSKTMESVALEYLGHANLALAEEFGAPKHNGAFNNTTHSPRRLFIQMAGRSFINLPDGFGIPIHSGEELRYFSMAKNPKDSAESQHVRFKTHLHFKSEATSAPDASPGDLKRIKPLFGRELYILQPIDLALKEAFEQHHELEFNANKACQPDLRAGAEQRAAARWLVSPGKHVFRQRVTDQLALPFDTTVHYLAGHVRSKAKTISLRDITSNEDVFTISGHELLDEFHFGDNSMVLHNTHEYELICEYDNDTKHPIDAMAMMVLYLHDKQATLPGR